MRPRFSAKLGVSGAVSIHVSTNAARETLRAVLTPAEFVDACAVLGAFNIVDRIADATGLPLDDRLAAMSGDVRRELGISRFGSAANSPHASA